MNDKEFCDVIHMEIHALRRIKDYKPSPSEINISKLVMDKFLNSCKECRERKELLKNIKPQKGFMEKLSEFR